MMTKGMIHPSSYSDAPMAEAMVMPSPVFMRLPMNWKPIRFTAGAYLSRYSSLPANPPMAMTTDFARSSCASPRGPSTFTPTTASPSWMSSTAVVLSIVRTPRRCSSAANTCDSWRPGSTSGCALTSGFTVSVPTISFVNDFSNFTPSDSAHAMVAQLSCIMWRMRL